MSLEYRYVCPLPNGVHARPANALEEFARGFVANVSLVNERTGQVADAKSVLSIVGADIRLNDSCLFRVQGQDEVNALSALTGFLTNTFPKCDEPLPVVHPELAQIRLPVLLKNSGAVIQKGVVVSTGIGRGRLLRAGGFSIPAELQTDGAADAQAEQRKLEEAIEKLVASYTQKISSGIQGVEAELLSVHRSMMHDTEFWRVLMESVHAKRRTAAGAIADAEAYFSNMLAASGNALLRERALDIQDICIELLQQIYGITGTSVLNLSENVIIVADALTPGQFLSLDRRFLKGMVLQQAGGTSHTVILARSFGIPVLTGVAELPVNPTNEAILDADLGVLVTSITEKANRYYQLEFQRLNRRRERLSKAGECCAATQEGRRVELAANIGIAEEASGAFSSGAEGIGLFRTEMLFLDRQSPPSEQEQFEAYSKVLEAAAGRPVIIRTLDIGGDKPATWLQLPTAEANPFLGWRAVRIYPTFEPLFRTQIRALIRASAKGQLKLLIPMIANVEEARWVKQVLAEEQARCVEEGIVYDKSMALGVMIEVPSAVFSLEELCREVDFFSIGSNDLLQYFVAADRSNARVASLYNPLYPSFLRLLKQTVDTVHAKGKWIGLCGEMGGQKRLLPLLVGLGLDEISAAAPILLTLKVELAQLSSINCRQLLEDACACATAEEASKKLDQFNAGRQLPLITPDLIDLDVEAYSKEEAIKQAVDLLYVHDRADVARDVELAVWDREATYSTGFGHSFAVPHCKNDAVKANTMVLLKLREPIEWGSLDNKPVRVIILLAMRGDAANDHLKVFAKLARQVMHEDFREQLEREDKPQSLCDFLSQRLGL